MQRRTFLQAAAAVAARSASAADERPLRAHAAARGLLYGAAANVGALQRDPDYAAHFAEECGILVPENALKFGPVHPEPERFDFTQGDFLADFAAKHDMKMRGHTLVWHEQLARWFPTTVTKENACRFLEEHIHTVVSRYKGRMHSWDVVNEAVHPPDGRDDGLRKTPWLELLGPEYLDMAYAIASAADPGAVLVYNDYGLDYENAGNAAKRASVLKLLRGLVQRKAPIRGFGMQAHLSAREQRTFKPETLRRFFGEIADLGLMILITELDVADQSLPADITERDRAVAGIYESYLTATFQEPAVHAVLTWGITDKYTWLANQKRRDDGEPVRVLPLDRDYHRKPAWFAMTKAFDGAGKRG
jgi:endo-1,4-beta-xylanase